jgi:Spy/CpxP family protein refolding chaperone
VFASALLLSGGIVGAIVAGPVLGQGWQGGPPWHHGFDGPRGWGPHRMMTDGPGGAHMLFPGPIERGVERLAWATDASTEQKQKMTAIAQKAADDIYPLRQQHLEARKQVVATLAAPTVDRAKLEQLRTDQMKLADTATKRVTDAVADIADVLTPAQRADLAQRFERWQRWFRG